MITPGAKRRFTRTFPCPICGGSDDDERGQSRRCFGFVSSDGQYAHCTREDHANGELPYHASSRTWAHKLGGRCLCGTEHGPAPPGSEKPAAKTIDATYDYRDADGKRLFQVVRLRPKGFRQRRPDPEKPGGWIWNLRGVEPVLYRLPELLAADPAETVFLVEGEKDADRLGRFGLIATCNPMGAGKWRDRYSESLRGRHVAIVPDNDRVGRDHAEAAAKSLAGIAAQVKLIDLAGDLPDLPEHGDVSDYLDRGRSIEDLRRLVSEAPAWRPAEPSAEFSGNGPPNGKPGGGFVGFVGSSPEVPREKGGLHPEESPEFEDDPRPLIVQLLDVPALDDRMLPAAFRAWLADHAERTCLPIDYAAVSALVALGALASRKLAIRPKRYDDWLVVPNLWGGLVGPPGILKTEGRSEGQRFLRYLQAQAAKAHAELLKTFERDTLIGAAQARAAKDELEKAAKKGFGRDVLETIATKAMQKDEQDPPPAPHYVLADSTIEALANVLPANPGVLIDRDELAGFLRTMDREGHQNDRAFYLESWAGLEPYPILRIGRGYVLIPRNCLGIFGTIQPGPLARYIRDAASNGAGNDGLLQRFQMLVYPDPPRTFVNIDRYPDSEAKASARAIFEKVDRFDPGPAGLIKHEDETRGLHYLGFSPEAQEFFDAWRTDLETRLRGSDLSAILQAHLGKYRSLMPSLALEFHLVEAVPTDTVGTVSLRNAEMAAAWCDYLEQHARRIYATAFDGDIEPAERLAERLKPALSNPFTYREVAQKGWAGLSSVEDVRHAVGILADRGWVQVVETSAGTQGGRPSEKIWIHPKLAANAREGAE